MEANALLDRFQNVSECSDGGFIASCTAHDDSRPSLRIWFDDNKTRMTCRAGCDTSDVISAVGLRWPDMFHTTGAPRAVPAERAAPVGPGEIAALRTFLDAHPIGPAGLSYVSERFGLHNAIELGIGETEPGEGFAHTGQTFSAHPRILVPLFDFKGVARGLQGRDISGNCTSRWVSLSNPEGKAWQKYGYFRTASASSAVIVTEGPSDALTALAAGYNALLIRGASLASNEDLLAEITSGLSGMRVFVAGDNDDAGNKFNQTLAAAMDVFALPIPVAGWDLTNWRESSTGTFHAELFNAMKKAGRVVPAITEEPKTATPATDESKEAARIVDELSPRYGASDVLRAHALVEHTGGKIKYSPELGFFVWNGTVWVRSENRVRQLAHQMGAELNTAAMERGENPKEGFTYRVAAGFTSSRMIDALIRELKAVEGVLADGMDFDARTDILSFRNGVVDLRTGTVRPHDPADLLTVSLPFDYDPDATCPRWEQFIVEIMPGMPDMPGYLQRLIGYGITGHTSEQCFAVLHGKGANGKSVLCDTLADVFHEITKDTPFNTFEDRASGGIPNDLAALREARLVTASEGEAGRHMAEGVIKKATGDKNMTARFMRGEFFTFTPRFLVLMATNHKPKFKGQDDGLWRRVKLIPFKRFFKVDERDYSLSRKLLDEKAGIAAWAVRGAIEWYEGGLQDPAEIVNATKEYRETSDALAGFVGDVVEITKEDTDTLVGKELFNAYLEWCAAENLPAKEQWRRTTFFAALEERGAVKKRVSAGMAFEGVKFAERTSAGPSMPETGDIFGE